MPLNPDCLALSSFSFSAKVYSVTRNLAQVVFNPEQEFDQSYTVAFHSFADVLYFAFAFNSL